MLGAAKGIPLEEIEGIGDVLDRMRKQVLEVDCYYKRDGSFCSKRLKKPRTISGIELYISPAKCQRIMKMSDPEAVLNRPEEHMTLYRNNGSQVSLSSENGKITIRDSRKTSYTIMDVEHFIARID